MTLIETIVFIGSLFSICNRSNYFEFTQIKSKKAHVILPNIITQHLAQVLNKKTLYDVGLTPATINWHNYNGKIICFAISTYGED